MVSSSPSSFKFYDPQNKDGAEWENEAKRLKHKVYLNVESESEELYLR